MNDKLKILVIVGTVREGRVGRKIADWYLKQAKEAAPETEFEILDPRELNLPLFNEPEPPLSGNYSPIQKTVAEKIASADAYVFVTGEYNHSIPGSLKNLLDYVAAEWGRKAAAFVGYSGTGAIRSIEHLIQICNAFGVATTRGHITINAVWEALDETGTPKDGYLFGNVKDQLTDLMWWAGALKAARD